MQTTCDPSWMEETGENLSAVTAVDPPGFKTSLKVAGKLAWYLIQPQIHLAFNFTFDLSFFIVFIFIFIYTF